MLHTSVVLVFHLPDETSQPAGQQRIVAEEFLDVSRVMFQAFGDDVHLLIVEFEGVVSIRWRPLRHGNLLEAATESLLLLVARGEVDVLALRLELLPGDVAQGFFQLFGQRLTGWSLHTADIDQDIAILVDLQGDDRFGLHGHSFSPV
jgi:hypothetical protein